MQGDCTRCLRRNSEDKWVADPPNEVLLKDPERRERGLQQIKKFARVLNFIEDELRIVTKRSKLVPFILNDVQEIIVQLIALCWVQLRPAQILVPKSRQMGVSTLFQALFFSFAFLFDHYRALTVAHQEVSANMIFRMSRTFEQHLPPAHRRELKTKSKGCLEWKEHGSMIQVATIGTGDGLGMGYTLNGMHGSEVAVWEKRGDTKAAWTSLSPAIAENEDTLIAFETTPDGKDGFFYDLCEKALAGYGDWEAVGLWWYLDPTYSVSQDEYAVRVRRHRLEQKVSFELTLEEQALCSLVAAQPWSPAEQWIRWPTALTLEQILWRRLTIQNKCSGDVELFNRFYPSTWEMAFRAREAALFGPHTIERYKASSRDPRHGAMHLVSDLPAFRERTAVEQQGAKWSVKLWKKPKDNAEYILTADGSENVEGGDPSAAYVGRIRRDLGKVEVVAAIHGMIDPDLFAEQIDLLGQLYNDALVAPEVNVSYEVVRILRKRGYKNLYWRTDPTNPRSRTKLPGWGTTAKTRPVAISMLKAMCRDADLVCYDKGFPEEMGYLVPGPKGRWEARVGQHDDRILAMAILAALAGFRDKRGRRVKRKSSVSDTAEDDAVAAMARHRAWSKARQSTSSPGRKSVSL